MGRSGIWNRRARRAKDFLCADAGNMCDDGLDEGARGALAAGVKVEDRVDELDVRHDEPRLGVTENVDAGKDRGDVRPARVAYRRRDRRVCADGEEQLVIGRLDGGDADAGEAVSRPEVSERRRTADGVAEHPSDKDVRHDALAEDRPHQRLDDDIPDTRAEFRDLCRGRS